MAERVDATVMEALRHPLRLAILVVLDREGELTPGALAAQLGATEGEVHQQIAVLHECGLVADDAPSYALRVTTPGWSRVSTHLRGLSTDNPDSVAAA